MAPVAGLINSVRLIFCHTIIFFIRDDIGILLKTSSALRMAPVFASEFICKTAGDAAVILKHASCILQPRGNRCPTGHPSAHPVGRFGGLDSQRGPQLQGLFTYSICLISELGNSHSSHP